MRKGDLHICGVVREVNLALPPTQANAALIAHACPCRQQASVIDALKNRVVINNNIIRLLLLLLLATCIFVFLIRQ